MHRRSRNAKASICALAVVLFVSACAGTDSRGDGVDGPVMAYPDAGRSEGGMDALISGILVLDGDCLYVEGEVERYPVLWPAGTRWDESTATVVTPAGDRIAIGSAITGAGGYGDVDAVRRIAGDDAGDVALRCADNLYGEIAIINNQGSAVGPG